MEGGEIWEEILDNFRGFSAGIELGRQKEELKSMEMSKIWGFFGWFFGVFTGEDVGGVEGGEFRLFLAAPAKAAAPGQGRGAWKRQK